jgi:hypothetical protein
VRVECQRALEVGSSSSIGQPGINHVTNGAIYRF